MSTREPQLDPTTESDRSGEPDSTWTRPVVRRRRAAQLPKVFGSLMLRPPRREPEAASGASDAGSPYEDVAKPDPVEVDLEARESSATVDSPVELIEEITGAPELASSPVASDPLSRELLAASMVDEPSIEAPMFESSEPAWPTEVEEIAVSEPEVSWESSPDIPVLAPLDLETVLGLPESGDVSSAPLDTAPLDTAPIETAPIEASDIADEEGLGDGVAGADSVEAWSDVDLIADVGLFDRHPGAVADDPPPSELPPAEHESPRFGPPTTKISVDDDRRLDSPASESAESPFGESQPPSRPPDPHDPLGLVADPQWPLPRSRDSDSSVGDAEAADLGGGDRPLVSPERVEDSTEFVLGSPSVPEPFLSVEPEEIPREPLRPEAESESVAVSATRPELARIAWHASLRTRKKPVLVVTVRHDRLSLCAVRLVGDAFSVDYLASESFGDDGLGFEETTTASALPESAEIGEALDRLLGSIEHSLASAIVVFGGRFVRESIHTVPPVSPKLTALALRRIAKPEPTDAISWFPLAAQDEQRPYQVFRVERACVEATLRVLEQHKVRPERAVPENALVLAFAETMSPADAEHVTLVCDLNGDRLCLSFVQRKRVIFYTRSALAFSDNTEERLAGDIKRSCIYFARQFGDREVGQLAVMLSAPLNPDRLRSEIQAAVDAEVIVATPPAVCCVSDASYIGPRDGLGVGSALLAISSESAQSADMIPVEWWRKRVRKSACLALVVLTGVVVLAMLGVRDAAARMVESKRAVVTGFTTQVEEAKSTVASWEQAVAERDAVVRRLEAVTHHLDDTPDLARITLRTIACLPPEVWLDEIRIVPRSKRDKSSSRTVDRWEVELSCRTRLDYFHAQASFERLEATLESQSFVKRRSVDIDVDDRSKPFRSSRGTGSADRKPLRFDVTFGVRR